jgi:hemerythrin-like domain-containing protein
MENFTDELEQDHRAIQNVSAGMCAVAELLESGKQLDPSILANLVQFFRIFTEGCHQEKEEKYLFPLIETKGSVTVNRHLRELEHEHRTAASLVDQLARVSNIYLANPLMMRNRLASIIRELAEIYPKHIWREDYLLFPMARRMLSANEQDHLQESFDAIESEIGIDVHHAFESLAEELKSVIEYYDAGACPLCSAAA